MNWFIIVSGDCLLPVWCYVITWTNADWSSIEHLATQWHWNELKKFVHENVICKILAICCNNPMWVKSGALKVWEHFQLCHNYIQCLYQSTFCLAFCKSDVKEFLRNIHKGLHVAKCTRHLQYIFIVQATQHIKHNVICLNISLISFWNSTWLSKWYS